MQLHLAAEAMFRGAVVWVAGVARVADVRGVQISSLELAMSDLSASYLSSPWGCLQCNGLANGTGKRIPRHQARTQHLHPLPECLKVPTTTAASFLTID